MSDTATEDRQFISIIPNYANLRDQFLRDADLHANSLVHRIEDPEFFNISRSLVVAINIVAHSCDSVKAFQEFLERLDEIASKLAAHGDHLNMLQYEEEEDEYDE